MSVQNSLVLLNRILTLKDGFPFVAVVDTLAQSASFLVDEFTHNCNSPIIYLSFETVNKPAFATHFVDCIDKPVSAIVQEVQKLVESDKKASSAPAVAALKKTLVIIDSLGYVPLEEVASFVASLISPATVLLGVYHNDTDAKSPKNPNFPSHLMLLNYIASSIFEVEPLHKSEINEEEIDTDLSHLKIPIVKAFNQPTFKVILTNRRKSGRATTFKFIINSSDHTYELYKEKQQEDANPEDESLLKDLTTFNLTTSVKQKLAREQVDLPYMEAQQELGSFSGAIVYEFEKDDDYDEEDPYEDPF